MSVLRRECSKVPALLSEKLPGGLVRCGTCVRRCLVPKGLRGLCRNYRNIDGTLYNVGYGNVSAIESRPIEIKPLFHFYPGSYATTFSGWGCNLLCPWCQNWHLSKFDPEERAGTCLSPEEVVLYALNSGDEGTCASFNEPVIHLEFLVDVFSKAKEVGLYNTMVSNGTATEEALRLLRKSGLDAMNVDVKGCPETYRKFIGLSNPERLLKVASLALKLGIHVEMVYLVVTDANDWRECMEWVVENHLRYLGEEVPLHINRYYPAYKYGKPPTDLRKLMEVREMAIKRGIKYVYLGNIPDTSYLNTRCPRCGKVLIERTHYGVVKCNLEGVNRCPKCGYEIELRGVCKVSRRGF